jgi:hypothetical protein
MHAEALSILPLGAIDVERQRRESSGKWMVRADEETTLAIMTEGRDSAMPKVRAIDIDRFPKSARRGDSQSMALRQAGLNGAALLQQNCRPWHPIQY